MTHTRLEFHESAREKILRGATLLAEAVGVTLGPRSKSVLMQKKWGRPVVCNDGVTIAKSVQLPDEIENLGAQMLREAAEQTGDAVGDGTSTATMLAYSIFAEGLKNVTAGASAIDLKRGLGRGLKEALRALHSVSRPIASGKEREHVATISAHNDPEMGRLVAEATERVGSEGVITVEEAKSTETMMEVVEGMQFDRGYISPYFVSDPAKMVSVAEDCLILLYDRRLSSIQEIVPLLEQVAKTGQPLLIIADDVDGDALATLVLNRIRGSLITIAVKAPGFGDRRKDTLEDLAVLTGGRVIAAELGMKLEDVMIKDLGRARRVVVDRKCTTIVDGRGAKEQLESRRTQIRSMIAETTSTYDKEKLQERLAKLTSGVAVIRVGAPSESEMKSRKEALEDAICATRAAVAEGIVPGGGLALVRLIAPLSDLEQSLQGDEQTGVRILKHALEKPARQIAANSGADGGVVVEAMRCGSGAHGFDAATGRFCDLIETGIIDPTKVVRVALENAVSLAGTLLLTEVTLTEVSAPTPEGASPEALARM